MRNHIETEKITAYAQGAEGRWIEMGIIALNVWIRQISIAEITENSLLKTTFVPLAEKKKSRMEKKSAQSVGPKLQIESA